MDLIRDASALDDLESVIHSINPDAPILRTEKSQVDISSILERGTYRHAAWVDRHIETSDDPSVTSREQQGLLAAGNSSSRNLNRSLERRSGSGSSTGHALNSQTGNSASGHDHGQRGNGPLAALARPHTSGVTSITLRTKDRLQLDRC